MKLSGITRAVIATCCLLVLLVILFPPWKFGAATKPFWPGTVGPHIQYGFLLAPPRGGNAPISVDTQTLGVEILGVLCAGGLAWLVVTFVASHKGAKP